MAETAKKISMIPAKVQYDRNVKLSEKKMKVAAYCRVSTELEEQDSSYEAQVEYYTSKISENENWKNAGIYADATVIIGLKQNPTHGRRFSPIFFA